MKKIEANIVADSISPQGHRITSFLLTFPRFILAELNTHRMFSRNSASSRAIPFKKVVQMVQEDPFIPIAWQKDHKGMQGTEYITDATDWGSLDCCRMDWLQARDNAVDMAESLHNLTVTKQLCNRLLEPFMWHTVLVTATEFENFFELRCPQYKFGEKVFKSKKDLMQNPHKPFRFKSNSGEFIEYSDVFNTEEFWRSINQSQAEIHIQALAESMWDAMNESKPKELKAGEWHIPFGNNIDGNLMVSNSENAQIGRIENIINSKVKIATARCARLSYMTFDGEIDYEKDIILHDRLLKDGHFSPFEHCARAMSEDEYSMFIKGKKSIYFSQGMTEEVLIDSKSIKGWSNNFRGWIQYRYLIENQ